MRAGPPALVSAPAGDLGPGQVFDAVGPLGGVGSIFAGGRHAGLLEERSNQEIRFPVAVCSLSWPGNHAAESKRGADSPGGRHLLRVLRVAGSGHTRLEEPPASRLDRESGPIHPDVAT